MHLWYIASSISLRSQADHLEIWPAPPVAMASSLRDKLGVFCVTCDEGKTVTLRAEVLYTLYTAAPSPPLPQTFSLMTAAQRARRSKIWPYIVNIIVNSYCKDCQFPITIVTVCEFNHFAGPYQQVRQQLRAAASSLRFAPAAANAVCTSSSPNSASCERVFSFLLLAEADVW